MKITAISVQAKNKDRVNIMVDGAYRFSLDIFQVADLGIRKDKEYTEEELVELEQESQFGKLYGRALEYCLMRPHSQKEVRDYLWRNTQESKYKSRSTGEIKTREGVSQAVADRVLERLIEKDYVNDKNFTRYWVENRSLTKGASRRKLTAELRSKGIEQTFIEAALVETVRDDQEELKKVIAKKQARYSDKQKFMVYLAGQGFSYDDIKRALNEEVT